MKSDQIESVVVLDTNAYRRLGRRRNDHDARRKGAGIAARDASKKQQALLHPFVIVELAAHLGNVNDPEWNDARAALIVASEHCAVDAPNGQRMLALMNDSETALCRVAYQQDPPGHAEVSERLATLCRRIASYDAEVARTSGLPELKWWAQKAAEIEEDFVSDMMTGLIQSHVPTATSWDAVRRDPTAKAQALEIIDSTDFLEYMAEVSVKKARRLLGLAIRADDDLKARESLVSDAFPAAFQLYRAVLRKVAVDGVDVARTKYRNWIWDIHIAFSVGNFTVHNRKPIRLVSDDRMILTAAADAGLQSLVSSYDEYSRSLSSGRQFN